MREGGGGGGEWELRVWMGSAYVQLSVDQGREDI